MATRITIDVLMYLPCYALLILAMVFGTIAGIGIMAEQIKCECGGTFHFTNCGAKVCDDCGNHFGLARCFCGWTKSGKGDGRRELEEMGEVIDPEDY